MKIEKAKIIVISGKITTNQVKLRRGSSIKTITADLGGDKFVIERDTTACWIAATGIQEFCDGYKGTNKEIRAYVNVIRTFFLLRKI